MTFSADETSTQDSRPVELYEVELPTATFRLTSYDEDFTHGGHTYTAVTISRGETTFGSSGGVREVMVSIVADHELALALLGPNGTPPRSAQLTITRLQQRSGETRRVWRGPIIGFTTDEQHMRLRVPDGTERALARSLPFATVSRTCGHALYDTACAIARASYKLTPTVISISGTALVVSSVGGQPDQWARYGEVVRVADGERRTVLVQVGTAITLNYPFVSLANGDALELYAGCDHTVETCLAKFANVSNFGGHPELPAGNPLAPVGLGVRIQE